MLKVLCVFGLLAQMAFATKANPQTHPQANPQTHPHAHPHAHPHGKPVSPPTPNVIVEQVLARYRKAKAIQAKVKKTVTQEVMGSTSVSEGRCYFSKGKLRLEFETPEKSILVYDGQNIWVESRLDEKTVQVSHLKAGTLKRTDSLMASLFDRQDAMKSFAYVKTTDEAALKIYSFKPIEAKSTEVKHLEIGIDGNKIRRILYKDQMENTVSFNFSDVTTQSIPPEKFSYQPPKDAAVTEM